MTITNYLTIDTEEWFQVYYAEKSVPFEEWCSKSPVTIDRALNETLALLDDANAKATFFVVGWLGSAHPSLIKRISENGHEVASHSYKHRLVYTCTQKEFREDVCKAKRVLEDVIGREVRGFRAPGYSIREQDWWALPIIYEAGHHYDSSLLWAGDESFTHATGLREIPPGGIKFWGSRIPVNGGLFFRLTPYILYKQYLKYLNLRKKRLNFYTHSWEIYTEYPRLPLPFLKRLVQYVNLESVSPKLKKLLTDFQFSSIEDVMQRESSKYNLRY